MPTVTVTSGPEWASQLNTALETIDAHDHSSGKGTKITPSGMNISSDLEFNSNNATELRSTRFDNQGASLNGVNDIRCVYVSGNDLYYNNGSGTAVQITSGAGINAASIGGIGGDYASSSASVSYSNTSKTFTFTQSSNTSAHIDVGNVVIRQATASANGVTLRSPNSLSAAYNFILPTGLPGSGTTKILSIDSSGQVGAQYDVDDSSIEVSSNTIQIKDSGVTTAKVANGNITNEKLNADVATNLTPTAMVVAYAGTSAPSGWLLCDGSAVSRTTYSALFAIIGVTHGQGDGSTTFNVPDYRGRFLRGVDGSAGNDPDKASRSTMATGGNSGNNVGSVQSDQYASHTHTDTATSVVTNGGILGSFPVWNISGGVTGSRSVANSGGNETRPKNAYVNFIIKT